jgi:ABC-type Fe3+-hydroxamate transport system substrate-binding protein
MPNGFRRVLSGALLLTLAATVVACGDDSSDDAGADEAGGDAVTVEHALGTTTVDGPVERVVALGPTDLDAALALGATVVGAASSGVGEGVPPWTAAVDGADELTVLEVTGDASQVDLEEVAALDPDLILAASYYDIDAAYEDLSQIAPTTAYEDGPVTDTWQQVTTQVGAALGEDEAAADLVADVEGQLAALGEENPELAGGSFTFGYVLADAVQVLRDPDDVMMTVPAALGLELSEPVLALPEGESFAVPVSYEQLEALDADVLALYDAGDTTARDALEASPLYAGLPVVERGGVVDLDDDQFFALRQPTALSVPFAIETVAPALAAAAAAA